VLCIQRKSPRLQVSDANWRLRCALLLLQYSLVATPATQQEIQQDAQTRTLVYQYIETKIVMVGVAVLSVLLRLLLGSVGRL